MLMMIFFNSLKKLCTEYHCYLLEPLQMVSPFRSISSIIMQFLWSKKIEIFILCVLRSLYFSFINPHVDYNILNWGMASPTNLDPIDKKIKKAVRIISFKDSDHPSAPLYKNLKILPLSNSLELRQAKHNVETHQWFPTP